MHNFIGLLVASVILTVSPAWAQESSAADQAPGFDCSNPLSSVESAVCGDAELAMLYSRTEAAYKRLKSRPGAFDIMLDLVRSRAACIKWKVGEPYKSCIKRREMIALIAYKRLELGLVIRPTTGHGAPGIVI